MIQHIKIILLQSIILAAVAGLVGVIFNEIRADGILLVTDVPYEIFAQCKDSEAESTAATTNDLLAHSGVKILYVDARPAEMFAKKRVKGAVNAPYSALFGASEENVKKIADKVKAENIASVIVYGAYVDPESPNEKVDFGKPLSLQLAEAKIPGVKYVKEGLGSLEAQGVKTESEAGDTQ